MKGPNLATLRSRIPSKYLLVAVTAKRARQLMEGAAPRLDHVEGKPVTVALEEVARGIIVPGTAETKNT